MSSKRQRRAEDSVALPHDRFPPHSIEAEQGVLGCCLLDAKEALGLAMERIGGREVFFDGRHQELFSELAGMVNEGVAIDPIVLQTRLRDKGALDRLGGMGYIGGLLGATPTASVVERYLGIVLEKWRLREMIRVCQGAVLRCYDEQDVDVGVLINQIEADVLTAGKEFGKTTVVGAKELVHRVIDMVEHCFRRGKGVISGLSTGFSYFDKQTGGLHPEMIVIGARPSLGKTSLMMNIVEHVGVVRKEAVGVFSLEMAATDVMFRALCARGFVNMQQIRTGYGTERDLVKLTKVAPSLANAPIYIDETASLDVLTFRARARRMVQQYGVKLIAIDYLQLMRDERAARQGNRENEVRSISGHIKAAVKELGIPILVLSQLNRESDKDKNRRPGAHDIRESGAIEQDADLIGLLYRPKEHVEKGAEPPVPDDEKDIIPVNLLIVKQRNGPTGDCQLLFQKKFMKFADRNDGTGTEEGEGRAREYLSGMEETNDKGTNDKGNPKSKGGRKVEMPTDEELGLVREVESGE